MKVRLGMWMLCGLMSLSLMAPGCTAPTQDPVGALVAAEIVLAAIDGADADSQLQAAMEAVAGLTDSQLASMVNLGLGEDWSLEDAAAVKELLAQIDEDAAAALEDLDIDEDTSPADIVDALADAGIDATEEQVVLLQELLGAVEGVGAPAS